MPSVDLFETFEVTRGARPRAWLIIFGYLKSCVKKERGTENDAQNDKPPFSIKPQASFTRGSVQVDVILGYDSVGFFRRIQTQKNLRSFHVDDLWRIYVLRDTLGGGDSFPSGSNLTSFVFGRNAILVSRKGNPFGTAILIIHHDSSIDSFRFG